jgi:hypothetical protein
MRVDLKHQILGQPLEQTVKRFLNPIYKEKKREKNSQEE